MNILEFREDTDRCLMLKRVMEMDVVKRALATAFENLDLEEAAITNARPDASPNLELRLLHKRKGYVSLLNSLKMMCEPLHDNKPEDREPDYGADEILRQRSGPNGWNEFNPTANL